MATASAVATRPIRPIPPGSNSGHRAVQEEKSQSQKIDSIDREVGRLLARANKIVYANQLGQYLQDKKQDEPGGYACLVAAVFTALDSRQL